jgi:thymidylate synthase
MQSYLDILSYLLEFGRAHDDRTGVGTRRTFGYQWVHHMGDGFPLLTTKRVSFRWVFEELAWFLSGSTDERILRDKGVDIWKEWKSPNPQFEGDMGPIYGKQFRDFGGVDQIAQAIDMIMTQPNSRRIIVTAWNPPAINEMALPPCHCFFQIQCPDDFGLSMHMVMRSTDAFLGLPFNIASYALLLQMMARVTGRKADRLVVSFGDLHIYNNHLKQVELQLSREPRVLPEVIVTLDGIDPTLSPLEQLLAIRWENIKLVGYMPHPKIEAPVAV